MTRTHGNASTYRGGGCRCEPCRDANRAYQLAGNATRAQRLAKNPTLAPHGSASTYSNWGCRCEPCTTAWSAKCTEYKRARRARTAVAP